MTTPMINPSIVMVCVFMCIVLSQPVLADCEFESDSDTVALWHFNEGSGQSIADASGNSRDLTLGPTNNVETADPAWSEGAFDDGLFFDSSICDIQNPNCIDADYANGTGSNTFPDNEMSIELWIKPTGGSGGNEYAQIFTAGFINAFMATRLTGNQVQVGIGDGSNWETLTASTGSVDLDDGEWHYLAMTYGANVISVYVDGQPTGSQAGTTVLASPGDYKIGGRPFNTFLDGWMDEIRISDSVRSISDIKEAWNRASACLFLIFEDGFEQK